MRYLSGGDCSWWEGDRQWMEYAGAIEGSYGSCRDDRDHPSGRFDGVMASEECTLYVTLEPCPMCAGAILQARIPRVVFGARDPKAGAVDSLFHLLNDSRLNHQCEVKGAFMALDCGSILTEFFEAKRKLGKK